MGQGQDRGGGYRRLSGQKERRVLYLDVPPFDVLTSQAVPYTGFGDPLAAAEKQQSGFQQTENRARKRVLEVFNLDLSEAKEFPGSLEAIIAQMWSEGWQPEPGDINLFATDFGCLLTGALRQTLGGQLVFRSPTDLSHLSMWWPKSSVEAFPFHKTYKRLQVAEGDSIAFFARSLTKLVGG